MNCDLSLLAEVCIWKVTCFHFSHLSLKCHKLFLKLFFCLEFPFYFSELHQSSHTVWCPPRATHNIRAFSPYKWKLNVACGVPLKDPFVRAPFRSCNSPKPCSTDLKQCQTFRNSVTLGRDTPLENILFLLNCWDNLVFCVKWIYTVNLKSDVFMDITYNVFVFLQMNFILKEKQDTFWFWDVHAILHFFLQTQQGYL